MSIFATRRSALFASACALVLVAHGCDCGGGNTQIVHCITDADCSTDGSKFCDTHVPAVPEADERGCVIGVKQCTNEGQCCPGQICSSQASICFDKFVQCTDDSTCSTAVRGQVCKPMGESQDKGCTFELCGAVDATTGKPSCPEGTSCFNGYCVGEPPCKGGCAAGSVCTPVNNRCFLIDDPVTPYPASCQQNCKPGTVLVFKNGQNVFNRCDRRDRECECAPLPPVAANDVARHSSAGIAGESVFVSAYDGDHGDLVVHEFDKATQKLKKSDWVDGIPSAGAVVGDPDGPRGGRSAAGPDVGQFTSLAYDASAKVVHVSYYATKDANTPLGNLKYAYRTAGGAWKSHTVDGQSDSGTDNGDVGMYSSIALSSDGFPIIAYFMKAGAGAETFKTGLKVARAKVRNPEKTADWTITLVEAGTRTAPPCANPVCAQDEVCTQSATNANGVCRKKAGATDCKNPACASDEACVLVNNVATCKASLRADTLAALPEGNGLFPSIAYLDDKPVVVWYDRNLKVLKGASASSDSATAGTAFGPSKVLDDGVTPGSPAGAPAHDVGQFVSLAVGPASAAARLAVAYFDVTARQLRVITAKAGWTDVTPPAGRVADDGTGTPETDPTLFVGADTSIRFASDGTIQVAYQDSTRNDLRLAVQSGTTYTVKSIASDGAGGFYANLLVDGADRYATHAIIKARSPSESANKLELIKLQLR